MKSLARVVVAIAVFAIVAAVLPARSAELPLPQVLKVQPGTSVIAYAGQQIQFTTPAPLRVKLEPLGVAGRIKLTVVLYPGAVPPSATAGNLIQQLDIYWQDVGQTVYSGDLPVSQPITEILNTEGGFTEK